VSTRSAAEWAEDEPTAGSPVLLARRARLSQTSPPIYGESSWNVTSAVWEAHGGNKTISWETFPPDFVDTAKRYTWMLLNFEPTSADLAQGRIQLAIATIVESTRRLSHFFNFLSDRDVQSVCDVTEADLDAYAMAVSASAVSVAEKQRELREVVRLWYWRDFLPVDGRPPAMVPWRGRSPIQIVGDIRRDWENFTPVIDEFTMSSLLAWSLRFVEVFADDIVAAAQVYHPLHGAAREYDGRYSQRRGLGSVRTAPKLTREDKANRANVFIAQLRAEGGGLPGRIRDGRRELDIAHIRVVLGIPNLPRDGIVERILLESGLPIENIAAALPGSSVSSLEGQPWLPESIAFTLVPVLERHLRTACMVVIAYLSGMRPGEVLNLRRGCVSKIGELWAIDGLTFKGIKDADGGKAAEGVDRQIPWIVVEQAANAVAVLERLHNEDLLFPASALRRADNSADRSVRSRECAEQIAAFTKWVNEYCARMGRRDVIPRDQRHPRVNLSRFRRTLAWHLCRRPGGLIAAGIQYGHVLIQVTQGYGGTSASGFPDEYAFERFLSRMEDLGTAVSRLGAGEGVSGPSAEEYQNRIEGQHFAGIFATTGKQARKLLQNPSLQIYTGRGMTCVYNPARALCRLHAAAMEAQTTPDLTDCRDACTNIARTDRDIAHLEQDALKLREIIADPLAPEIRTQRDSHRLANIESTIAAHYASAPVSREKRST
jgi:integrase